MEDDMNYTKFLEQKTQFSGKDGFKPVFMPDYLFDFQKYLLDWNIRRGRSAIFADCGLGKTPMQLVWSENVVRKTNGNVLILSPLAVSPQTIREGEKFGIEVKRSRDDGKAHKGITITNYEQLEHFNPSDFVGVVCDESSILKNFSGTRRKQITEFMRKMRYRLLCTATAAPNDYIELGTSSEALGAMGYMDMLGMFFKNTQANCALKTQYRKKGDRMPQWRFKKHAEPIFWKWVCSWAMAIRKPSDIGFNDDDFKLPELQEEEHAIYCSRPLDGNFFAMPAIGLKEQRQERRATINERCEKAAELVEGNDVSISWCHLNDEGDLLEKLIPNSIQIAGKHSEEYKEKTVEWFLGERCICNDPMFRGKMATWEKEKMDTGKSIIERIVTNALKNQNNMGHITEETGKSITRNIMLQIKNKSENKQQNIEKGQEKTGIKAGENDTPMIQSIEKSVSEILNNHVKITQKQEQTFSSKSMDQNIPIKAFSKNKAINVQYAEGKILETTGIQNSISTIVTEQKQLGDCYAPLVILDSESLMTIQKLLAEQQCTCGRISGKRRLISKPSMFGYGLNLQHCSHMTFFPSHSYEQYYQSVRRCWRFGQKNPVKVDIISTEGEINVLKNLQRKALQANKMFDCLVEFMGQSKSVKANTYTNEMEIPSWL